MRASILRIAILLSCGLAGPLEALPQTSLIGLSFDPAGESCEMSIPIGTPGTMYVLAYLGQDLDGCLTGAEFQVTNFPVEWMAVSVAPNPAINAVVGNPLTGGVDLAFPTCQWSPSGVMTLFTVTFFASTQVTNRVVDVAAHSTPSSPEWNCPWLYGSDWRCFNFHCTGTHPAAINFPGFCTVPVASRTWSEVHGLFR